MSNKYCVVGQIKKDVDDAFAKQYTKINEKKQLKYYSLYLSSIVRIQRNFRAYLVRKNLRFEKQICKKLDERVGLVKRNQRLNEEIELQKERRRNFEQIDIEKGVHNKKQNIERNLEKMIKSVVETADKYSQNVAVSKVELMKFKKLTQEEEETENQIKEMELEKQCLEQRLNGWKEKLRELRERIMEENAMKREINERMKNLR